MNKRLKELGQVCGEVIGIVASACAIFGVVVVFDGNLSRKQQVIIFVFILTFCLLIYIISRFTIDPANPTFTKIRSALSFVPYNMWLWIFGNVENHDRIRRIFDNTTALQENHDRIRRIFDNMTALQENHDRIGRIFNNMTALQESHLFGQLAGIRSNTNEYHIIYSHKPGHPETPGNAENYRRPGFPADEAETIMRIWHSVASNGTASLSSIRTECACCWLVLDEVTHKNEFQELFKSSSLAIIGSPKDNPVCQVLMDRIMQLEGGREKQMRRNNRYRFAERTIKQPLSDKEDRLVYLKGELREEPFEPTSTLDHDPNEVKTDYALFMKIPNILANEFEPSKSKNTILLMAGCKAGGQCGLEQWLFNTDNQRMLVEKWAQHYFYMIFKISYKFVKNGLPHIINTEVCHEEPITFSKEPTNLEAHK